MPYLNYTQQEVHALGRQIYEQEIRDKVEAGNKGSFVVIDIETGQYELDINDLEATKRALAKRPDAVLYGVRIGYPTAYTLGGHIATDVR